MSCKGMPVQKSGPTRANTHIRRAPQHRAAGPAALGPGATAQRLQRTLGNQATQALLRRAMGPVARQPGTAIQTKLEVGAANDPLEREADVMAERVMRMTDDACCPGCANGGGCEGNGLTVHRAPAAGATATTLPAELEEEARQLTTGGQPLPETVRAKLEPRFGADLSGVRVHRDAAAAESSAALGAKAWTLGNHIAFGAGQWAPGTEAGERLLAHELAHTQQQGNGSSGVGRTIQRYSWDEFVSDVEGVGEAVVDGAEAVGEAVVTGAEAVAAGAEAVGEAVVAGGEAVVAGAEAVGTAAGEAISWMLTEAGQLALRGANALAQQLGGSVTVGPDGLVIELPEVPLFDVKEQVLVPPVPRVFIPLAAAGTTIGILTLVGSFGVPLGAPVIRAFLGPGRLQNIRIRIDPVANTYSASGELYVGAALNEYLQTGLAARLDALVVLPTDPPFPVWASVEGGGLVTLQGSAATSITRGVTLSYTAGTIGLDFSNVLEIGVLMEADLDAYLNAQLYEIEVCEFIWPLEHWEASEAYSVSLPISISYSGGRLTIVIGPLNTAPMDFADIETGLKRFRPESRCKTLEELIAELCRQGFIPPELCPAEEGDGGDGAGPSAKSNRVRLQLQHKGDDVVPAVPIEKEKPVTVAEGHAGVDTLMGRTSKSVGKACKDAASKMKKTISGYPPSGVSAIGNVARKYCKDHPDYERGIRMDLENLAGTNFTS